jgi:rare lipoprotein A
LLALLVAGCTPQALLPPGSPEFLRGEPYAMGGLWSYPREDFAGSETGVASVLPASARGRRTANGEIFDPARMVAAHRTLQLPAIVIVRNLENGRETRVRVNDRGPQQVGRVIGVSPRAAELLGILLGGVAQVRVTVDELPSRALASALPSREPVAPVAEAAPRAAVESESLAPLAGARSATPLRAAPVGTIRAPAVDQAPALPPDPLPETVTQHAATPGRPRLEAGTFFRRDLAQRQAAALGGQVEIIGTPRAPQYRVLLGPYADAAAADRALAIALHAGATEMRLVIE